MPAFGKSHSDEEIWQIVAFLRKLDNLSASQVAALREGEEAGHHPDAGNHEAVAGHDEAADRAEPREAGSEHRLSEVEGETPYQR
jgi:hypothetical protein